jgi:tRNA threonylcarbamoyladenosine biosynthesis protein TsaB
LEVKVLLAVDTSTQTIGIALYDHPQVSAELLWMSKKHHTVELAAAVKDLMNKCGVTAVDLSLLVCALGPGTFTGLRIGLAFAKGLALSLRIPIIGIPTFDFLADSQPLSSYPMACVLPAGRSRLAVNWYANGGTSWLLDRGPMVLTPETLSEQIEGPTIICGEIAPEDRQVLSRKWKNAMVTSPAASVRHPAMLAELGWQRWEAGQRDDPVTLSPIYLHVAGSIPD